MRNTVIFSGPVESYTERSPTFLDIKDKLQRVNSKLKKGLLAVLVCFAGDSESYYLFPGAYPFTDFYGNIGGVEPSYAYGGYGIGDGFPYYPLGYGGYGNLRSYSYNTLIPGGVFGQDGCGCDGYGKYGCNC